MARPDGAFIWYELMTPDPDAAKPFYDAVVGWTMGARPEGPMDYRMIDTGDGLVGGVLRLDQAMIDGGAVPAWLPYLGVADVDAKAAQVREAGGQVTVPPTDIPGVGRFAMLVDPGGAPFYIMRGDSPEESTSFAPRRLGHAAWNELYTPDQGVALNFYGRLFGMEKTGAMPMGPMGDYTFLSHADEEIGAMMTTPPGRPSGWGVYFKIADVAAAAVTIKERGGTVIMDPHEVPSGQHIVVAADPAGAVFGLVSGDRAT